MACDCMKKLMVLIFALVCIMSLAGCSVKGKSYSIEIIIPAGSTEAFVYSDEEISPQKNYLEISAGAGIDSTQVILKSVEVREKTAYEPVIVEQRKPVKMDVEKGAWLKIGIGIMNPSDNDITASIIVENVEIRIE